MLARPRLRHGSSRRRQAGVTLVELMIGSTLGLIVLSSVLVVYHDTIVTSSDSLRMAQLNQQVQATLEIMHRDVRRAGYVGAIPSTSLDTLRNNPFTSGDNNIRSGNYHNTSTSPAHSEPNNTCLLYSYDKDGDGSVDPPGEVLERFGFRLLRGALQMRMGGDAFNCTEGSWAAITDDNIEITELEFEVTETGRLVENPDTDCSSTTEACIYVRKVTITIEAQLRNDTNVTQQRSDIVRLRNDRYQPPA